MTHLLANVNISQKKFMCQYVDGDASGRNTMSNLIFDDKKEAIREIAKETFLSQPEIEEGIKQCGHCNRWGLSDLQGGSISTVCQECLGLISGCEELPKSRNLHIGLSNGQCCLIDSDGSVLLTKRTGEQLHEFEKRCAQHGKPKQ
jgi:hypothetical protein